MAAKNFRIGNDLVVLWAICNRDGSPYDLAKKEVRLYVINQRGRKEVAPILTTLPDGTINNVIRWDFNGMDQRVTGLYTLTVEIFTAADKKSIKKDYCEAFCLVGSSSLEDESLKENISDGGELILSTSLDAIRLSVSGDFGDEMSEIRDSLKEVAGSLEVINETIADISQESINIKTTINGIQSTVNDIGTELVTKASAQSVIDIGNSITEIQENQYEQSVRVDDLGVQIETKASKEDVTIIDGAVTKVSGSLAEQIVRVDDVEASIKNKVSKEEFDVTTGEIELEFTSVKQTTDGIEETIKSQSGEITSIKENINGITVGIGTLQSDLNTLRNQIDGVTESYFEPYVPSNDNEPAKTWIEQGKQEEHKGDTFTNTALEGDGAGKSWRWLQNDNGEWGWQLIADTEVTQALALAAQAKAAADGKVTIFYIQPSNYKEGDIWFVHSNDYFPYEKGEILTAINESSVFDLAHWENKTRYTEAIKDLDNVMNTTFKDGVLDEAERISIIESLGSLTNEKSAVDARYNITIVNADFTDDALKNDYKALKSAYDLACDNLIAVVEQIANAKSENLSDLFDDYETASTEYANAYSAYIAKEAEVNEALMGRLNPASKYLDDITNDGVLTPIEKEQLFEIYRSISKEYDATRSNAYTYKVWKYNADETAEESGLNGGEGRYEKYVAFKAAYANVASVFGSTIWGFSNMKETTTLPEGYSTTLLKGYLDVYYETLGEVSESFSAITVAIEEAQKASAATLQALTDNLLPEEMSTTIGKGVVLSTIIATRDTEGNITAGMNASKTHSDKSDKNHGRIVFVGGAKQLDDLNNAAFVVYEDGHVKMNSAEIAKYASTGDLALGLGGKADNEDVEALRTLVENISKLWKLQDGVLVTDYDVLTKGQFAAGKVGTEGEGGGGFAYLADLYDVALSSLVSGDLLSWNGNEWINIKQSSLVPDLSAYATKNFVTSQGYIQESIADGRYATMANLGGVDYRLALIEKYFATSEDAGTQIDKWNEIVEFLNATEGTTLAGILATYATNDALAAVADSKITICGITIGLNGEITQEALRTGLGLDTILSWYDTIGKFFKKNADGTFVLEGDLITLGQFAAKVAGEEGTGGGGVMLLTTWPTTSGDYSGYALGGNLGVELNTRVRILEDKTITWSEINGRPTMLSQFGNDLGLGSLAYRNDLTEELVENALGFSPFNAASFNKTNIKSTLGISDWALLATKPSYKTSELTEETNLFFTDARAVAACASTYLSLSGGTISGSGSDILCIDRTTSSSSPTTVCFYSNGGLIGRMGYDPSSYRPVVQIDGAYKQIIHEGNIGEQSVSYANSAGNASTVGDRNKYGFAWAEEAYPAQGNYNYEMWSGFYKSNGKSEGLPNTNTGCSIINCYFDSNAANQLFLDRTQDYLAFRRKTGGVWYSWKTIAFLDSNVASAQSLVHSNGAVGATVNSSGNVEFSNGINIGGIRIYAENGVLKIDGDLYTSGQFASGTIGN